ncbi:MAG: hypothetical protein MUF54_20515 [Polyangiaceae bacterium]|nr:hypothetical protein [Polyangiaceae bacterium]
MTETKPYVHRDDSSRDRSVAVLLVATAHDDPSEPRWLQPCGGPSLLHRALDLLDRLDEADEKLFWSDDSSIIEHFEQAGRTAIRLLPGPPAHALRRDQPRRPASDFVLRFDGRCHPPPPLPLCCRHHLRPRLQPATRPRLPNAPQR